MKRLKATFIEVLKRVNGNTVNNDIEQETKRLESQFKQQTVHELSDVTTESILGKRYNTRQYTKDSTQQNKHPLDNVPIARC